jgi:hypothetical protein
VALLATWPLGRQSAESPPEMLTDRKMQQITGFLFCGERRPGLVGQIRRAYKKSRKKEERVSIHERQRVEKRGVCTTECLAVGVGVPNSFRPNADRLLD